MIPKSEKEGPSGFGGLWVGAVELEEAILQKMKRTKEVRVCASRVLWRR